MMQAPIERLPDEVLALLFRFVDPKTLLMAIPAVSAWSERGRAVTPSSQPGVQGGPPSVWCG